MPDLTDVKVGDVLHVETERWHDCRGPCVVTKVGRVWLTIRHAGSPYARACRVRRVGGALDGGEYMSPGTAWISREQFERHRRERRAWLEFSREVSRMRGALLEDTLAAAAILGIAIDTEREER